MKKVSVFKKESSYIRDVNIRKDLRKLISLLPDYFFEIPASLSGKYHPSFALGEGGLVRHTKATVRIAYELLNNEITGSRFTDRDKDLIIMALVLHDGLKCGIEKDKHTSFDHPLQMSKFILMNREKLSLGIDDIRKVCSMIESHMGQWTIDPETNKEILPKPRTEEQRFIHMCDFLASKKFIDIKFVDGDII